MAAAPPAGVTPVWGCIRENHAKDAAIQALTAAMLEDPSTGCLFARERLAGGREVPARVERLSQVPGPIQELTKLAKERAEHVTHRRLRLFKDKINFKFPGGAGFLPHQDTPAYRPYGDWHVSVLVPLTTFNASNGTLEFAPLCEEMPMERLATLDYTRMEACQGDMVVFEGLVPHRSGPNTSGDARIGLYLTFVNDREDPALMERYYAAKAQGHAGLSLNQVDFAGELV